MLGKLVKWTEALPALFLFYLSVKNSERSVHKNNRANPSEEGVKQTMQWEKYAKMF